MSVMPFVIASSTDSYVQYRLPQICNLQISNDDLANSIDIASSQNSVTADIFVLKAKETQVWDQNSFEVTSGTIYIKSSVAGAPANFRITGW